MYIYRKKSRIDAGSIFFIILFMLASAGVVYLSYADRGKFWDFLPFICIPATVISLIFIIVNFARRTKGSFFFILFFLLSVTGLILFNFFGPSALSRYAEESFDNKNYEQSINHYRDLLDNYPNSRYAGPALENISFAYFYNRDYKEAISSFNEAIEMGLLSDDDLEIKKALEECHVKLAEEYYTNDAYDYSADNYFKAVNVLEDIKNNFPDTNEAFISIHKIPEYLYKAALSFNKVENWDRSIECLEIIVSDYNESKYFLDASFLLSHTYINKSKELIQACNYIEGVEEFLKVLDIDALNYDYGSVNDHHKLLIFSNISTDVLKRIAREKYNSGEYKKSVFVCEIITEKNPGMEGEINPLLIDSKLKLISSSDYNLFEQPAPSRSFRGPERSMLVIENNTEFDLTIYLKGSEYRTEELEKNSAGEIEINSGKYEIALESGNVDILPYYGDIVFEEEQGYLFEYSIVNN
jgi:tetratricopeptide (TPR) repeat protein